MAPAGPRSTPPAAATERCGSLPRGAALRSGRGDLLRRLQDTRGPWQRGAGSGGRHERAAEPSAPHRAGSRRSAERGRTDLGAAGRGRLRSREPPAGSSAELNGALPGGEVGRAAERWGQTRGQRRQRGARAAPTGAAESGGTAGGATAGAVRGVRRRGAAAAAPARSRSSSALRGSAADEWYEEDDSALHPSFSRAAVWAAAPRAGC